MTLPNIRKILQFDYLMLLLILGLAFYIAFIPHQDYPYPLHVDEWIHLAKSKAMLQAGSTTFVDPFTGQGTISISSNLESGFQLFWGVFQSISGISWMDIFRYFPSIIFMLTVLSVYIMAQKEGFGPA
jgi:asparagine N-glycosylation enzyme membrane subunit Stt3